MASRSSALRIFPVAVIGSALTKMTSSGSHHFRQPRREMVDHLVARGRTAGL